MTFTIYLPKHTELSLHQQTDSEASADSRLNESETILLVEDELAILKMTQTMLENCGYRVLAANSPAEAIQIAKGNAEIHLLITDVSYLQIL